MMEAQEQKSDEQLLLQFEQETDVFNSGDFSFSKKPIVNNHPAHSSQISIINNYPKQQYDEVNHDSDHHKFYSKYKGILKDKDEPLDEIIDDLNFEFNYDEKIRAPRVSLVNVFKENTHSSKSPTLAKQSCLTDDPNKEKKHSITSLGTNRSKTSFGTLDSLDENGSSTDFSNDYKPASFDLSKPTRKFSVDSSTSPTNLKFVRQQYQYQYQYQQPNDRVDNTNFTTNNTSNKDSDNSNKELHLEATTKRQNEQDLKNYDVITNLQQMGINQTASSKTLTQNTSPHSNRSFYHQNKDSSGKRVLYDDPTKMTDPREIAIGDLTVLKQINEPTKLPDYIPPVLRPIADEYNKNQQQIRTPTLSHHGFSNNTSATTTTTATTSASSSKLLLNVQKKASIVSTTSTDDSKYSVGNTASSSTHTTPPASVHDEASSTNNNTHTNTKMTNNSYSSPTTNTSTSLSSNKTLESSSRITNKNPNLSQNTPKSHVTMSSAMLSPAKSNNTIETVTSNNSSLLHQRDGLPNSGDLSLLSSKSGIEPSHSHWKRNSSATACKSCNAKFSILKRKHHCRHCGFIFCYSCLLNKANLNLLARFEKPKLQHDQRSSHSPPSSLQDKHLHNNTDNIDNQRLDQSAANIGGGDGGYCKFSKVCDTCFNKWLLFLENDYDYEVGEFDFNNNNNENSNERRESATTGRDRLGSDVGKGVPNDWTWSSF